RQKCGRQRCRTSANRDNIFAPANPERARTATARSLLHLLFQASITPPLRHSLTRRSTHRRAENEGTNPYHRIAPFRRRSPRILARRTERSRRVRAVNPARVTVPGSARVPQSRTFLISVLESAGC